MHCLEAGIITRFPSTHRTNGPPLAEEDIPVYCYCRTRQKGNMIECSNCEEWFHLKCDHSVSKKTGKSPAIHGCQLSVMAVYKCMQLYDTFLILFNAGA